MNYQTNIKQTYNIDLDVFSSGYGAYALMESGETLYIEKPSNVSFRFDELTYYYVNYAHRFTTDDTPVMYLANTPDNITLCCSTKVDYVLVYSSDGRVVSGGAQSNGTYYDVGDGVALSNYPNYNPNSVNASLTYGAYDKYFDDQYAIYDFSSVQGVNMTNYRQDSLYLRGENISYYHTMLSFTSLGSTFNISYGSPYFEYGNSEYERGYVNGYSGGSVDGYQNGYNDGVVVGGMDTNSATAFSYLGGAFNAVSGIMSLEVMPHITLGLIWTIPVVFAIITLIFKLVRK